MAKEEKFMVVTESFAGDLDDGSPIVLNQGQIRNADDPVVKKFKMYFKPLSSLPVEQATAAPGEKRQRTA